MSAQGCRRRVELQDWGRNMGSMGQVLWAQAGRVKAATRGRSGGNEGVGMGSWEGGAGRGRGVRSMGRGRGLRAAE